MTDTVDYAKLVEAGWIVLVGNEYHLTEQGRRVLRAGIGTAQRFVPNDLLPVDAVRSRLKPSIPKKKHRKR